MTLHDTWHCEKKRWPPEEADHLIRSYINWSWPRGYSNATQEGLLSLLSYPCREWIHGTHPSGKFGKSSTQKWFLMGYVIVPWRVSKFYTNQTTPTFNITPLGNLVAVVCTWRPATKLEAHLLKLTFFRRLLMCHFVWYALQHCRHKSVSYT